MYDFNYQRPTSLDAATKAVAAADDGDYLAGGMTLIPTMKQRLAQPSDLIDLGAIAELSGIRREVDEIRWLRRSRSDCGTTRNHERHYRCHRLERHQHAGTVLARGIP